MQGKGMTDMGENILLVAVLLLALYGCTQLIRWLVLRLLTPPARDKGVRILPLNGHRDDLEYLVRAAVVQRRWAGPLLKPERLILLDTGLDEESRQVAELLCRDAGVELWDLDALLEQFPEGASVPV